MFPKERHPRLGSSILIWNPKRTTNSFRNHIIIFHAKVKRAGIGMAKKGLRTTDRTLVLSDDDGPSNLTNYFLDYSHFEIIDIIC